MSRSFRRASLRPALLGLALSVPAPGAQAAPSDGSTLFASRGVAGARGEPGPAPALPDLFTGAAVHAIPLELPPGTGGLTPSLALRYSSAARGESWVGSGWSLALPAILRSLERGVPAYDDALDLLELDGEELVPESDTPSLPRRYHARRERFERIVRESDGSFTVTAPGGGRRRFGTSAESRIERASDGAVFGWLLAEEEDLHGNVIVVRYDRSDAGTAYPSEIRYTLRRRGDGGLESLDGDAGRDRVVRFVLEPRPDRSTTFLAGFERVLAHRLRAVQVTIGGERLRCWELGYAESPDSFRSLLTQVALHGADVGCDGGPPGTPPLVAHLRYRTNAGADPPRTGFHDPVPFAWPAGLSLVDASREDRGVRLGDVDGDGRPDLLFARAVETPGQGGDGTARAAGSGVYRNEGTGFALSPSSAHPLPAVDGTIGALSTSFALESSGRSFGLGLVPIDLDGDGRVDLAGGVRWLGWTQGSVSTYGIGGFQRNTGRGFEPAGDFADLLEDERWALARFGAIDFRWNWTGAQWVGGFEFRSLPGPARFADLDGDGLPELVVRGNEIRSTWSGMAPPFHPGTESCRFELSSYHFENEGALRFVRGAFVDAGMSVDRCGANAAFRVGLEYQPCDPFDASCQRLLLHAETRSRHFVSDGSWAHWNLHWEMGNEAIDLNADGLADHASAAYDVVLGSETWTAALNGGAGDFLPAADWRLPTHLYEITGDFSRDLGVRIADVNGDGRPDVLQAVEAGARHAWLGDGDAGAGERPGPWVASPAWVLPASLAFVNASGQDLGVRLLDLDGDGMTDVVRSSGGTDELYRNRGVVPDLLESITTPLGGRTTFRYVPSTAFDHTGNTAPPLAPPESDGIPRLPHVLQLVREIEISPGTEPAARTTFDYAGGVYDPEARELRGFRRVTATRADGRRVVTHFHQDEARAGLVEREDVFDAGPPERLLRSTLHVYTPDADGPPWVSLLARRVEAEHDDPADPRALASSFRYDAFGNVIERIDWGEVAWPPGEALADLAPADTRTIEVEMALGPEPGVSSPHVVDRVRRERVRQGPPATGAILRETVFRYDGDTTGAAPPTRGLVTARVDVRVVGTSAGPTTTSGYDAYGNRIWVRSPRANAGQGGGTTTTGIDDRWHTFRVSETDALGFTTTFRTSSPAGCAPYPAGAGVVQEERGPNLGAGEPGLRRCLDAFGRVVRERAPLDLAETRTVYGDAPGAIRVERHHRTSAAGAERTEVEWLDGLGRRTQAWSEGPGGRAVSASSTYDAFGRRVAATAPRFGTDPVATTTYAFDVLDRPVRVTHPGSGREEILQYGRARVTATDANGVSQTRVLDAFGRVARIEEGSGGAEVTSFSWDALGRLVEVRDPVGHRSFVQYDLLGRRVLLVDPDTGFTAFPHHDDDGNLLTRIDALGTTTWTYDALGRVLSRTAGGSTATFAYDTAARGKGLLATRRDDAGLLRVWAYDAVGRTLAESQETGGTTLFFSTSYDPMGNVSSRTLPTGRTIAYERDLAGYLQAVRSGSGGGTTIASGITWDARASLAAWTAGNGVTTRSVLDAQTGRLAWSDVRHGSTVLEDLAYGYDAGDRLVAITDRRPGGLPPRSFSHDGSDRLVRASGPYGAAQAEATLHYAYDAAGSLTCKDAAALAGCAGGTTLVYPATTGSAPRHAPATVAGLAASYDGGGNLRALGSRSYAYDALGRLASVADAGALRATHLYDAPGRRVESIGRNGSRVETQRFVRDDFTWDVTRGLAKVEVWLAGRSIATLVDPFSPGGASASAAPSRALRPGDGVRLVASAPTVFAALSLGLWLLVLRRRREGWLRPALAGTTALVFHAASAGVASAVPDGDLTGDGRLDAGDALLAGRLATGDLAPTDAAMLARGDVAPLEASPQSPPRVDAGDLVLLWRALRGEDVDGDGLAAEDELAAGASPFRADSDRDGLGDALERSLGTLAGTADSDADGLSDGAEVAAGSDPLSADTDGDGVSDAGDAAPRSGVVYRHTDHLGSTVLVTKSSGAGADLVLARVVHTPYGSSVGSPAPGERGFTGQRRDGPTGLYDYGARWYDPAIGRFLQPDPLVPDPLHPRTLNRYAYAEGDPMNRVDPTGHASIHFRVFAGTVGPRGFSGAGLDLAFGGGAGLRVDPWLSFDGVQARFARPAPPPLAFGQILSSPYANVPGGGAGAATAQAASYAGAIRTGLPPEHHPLLPVSALHPGDILLTGDQPFASYLRGFDALQHTAGHAALVLDVRGDAVRVLSAGVEGKYAYWNDRDSVGGRWWEVVRPSSAVRKADLDAHLATLRLYNGAMPGRTDAYFAGRGGNVCSSTVANALEAAGAPKEWRFGALQSPGRLRAYGSTIGRVYIPLADGPPQ